MSIEPAILEYKIKGVQKNVQEFFLNSREAHHAKERVKVQYGNKIELIQVRTGTYANNMYKSIYGKSHLDNNTTQEKSDPIAALIIFIFLGILLWLAR
ncbi:hypothetical protein [Arcobacter aquimarinus]|uniref:Uncharacterized protein n=1 Tax=Arcobacter aquimarinus TaxID=1315211 RepID=A0AAE7B7G2_9BACT|nr:hypothetical protein [Arcobacter aquimarinus]QKE27012.1 hypothetical protein AAQM_2313 [Arcobacter aquimarinus]RXI36921.1 hypothetical protein CP986_00275 [Arcobacter aquimarinus]